MHRTRLRAAGVVFATAAALCLTAVAGAPALGSQATDPTFVHTFTGQTDSTYGGAVSQLADIDGDRETDLIIGSPGFTNDAGSEVGLVEVRSGDSGDIIWELHGRPGERFGYSIADAGDVDGDRVHDIVVGAAADTTFDCANTEADGRVYVFSGRTGHQLWSRKSFTAAEQFGAAVATAGDVNRDGLADVVVGAPCYDTASGPDTGAAYVLSGKRGTLVRTHVGAESGDHFGYGAGALLNQKAGHRAGYAIGAPYASDAHGTVTLFNSFRGNARYTVQGDDDSFLFGWYFAGSAGDTNGDGVDDLYVGDFCGADPAGQCSSGPAGQGYVFSGRGGRELLQFGTDEVGAGMGPGRGAGDVNHDGYDDVVVGSYTSSAAAAFGGRVQVFSGYDGSELCSYAGPTAGQQVGFDAVGIGDVDDDHAVDLLVSAAGGDTVYVLSC